MNSPPEDTTPIFRKWTSSFLNMRIPSYKFYRNEIEPIDRGDAGRDDQCHGLCPPRFHYGFKFWSRFVCHRRISHLRANSDHPLIIILGPHHLCSLSTEWTKWGKLSSACLGSCSDLWRDLAKVGILHKNTPRRVPTSSGIKEFCWRFNASLTQKLRKTKKFESKFFSFWSRSLTWVGILRRKGRPSSLATY